MYTRGPWSFRRVNNVDHYRCVPTDAQDRELLKAVPIDRIAEVEANARLIATAPEMLDLLKAILQTKNSSDWHYDRLVSLIAKAEGKP